MSEYNGIKLSGWKKECNDIRDKNIIELVGKIGEFTIKPSIDLRSYCSPIEDQRTTNSCVACSTVGALELLMNVNNLSFTDLSRLFIYYNARVIDNDVAFDNGTYIRFAMDTLSSIGVCSESLWPFDLTKIYTRPSWKSYKEAYIHKITGYYKIFETGNERIEKIIAALNSKHPVIFGVKVYQNFIDDCMSGIKIAPNPIGKSIGRHAMLIVGYDLTSRMFIIRNSWGIDCGEYGYFYCPFEWLDMCDIDDIWVATLVK